MIYHGWGPGVAPKLGRLWNLRIREATLLSRGECSGPGVRLETFMPEPLEEAIVAPTGWRVSLDFCGTRLAEHSLLGDRVFSVGESHAASWVLPGLGGAAGLCDLTDGDWLLYVPGLAGEVVLSGQRSRYADFMVEGQVRLRMGDSARLHLVDQPEIVLTLSLEAPLRLGVATRFGIADLTRQLALGGLVVALFALLVRSAEPVPEIEMEGDEEATQTAFERVLFASLAELPVPDRMTPILEVPEWVVPEVEEFEVVAEIKDPDSGIDPELSPTVEVEELGLAGGSIEVVGGVVGRGAGRGERIEKTDTVDMVKEPDNEQVSDSGFVPLGMLDDRQKDGPVPEAIVGSLVESADSGSRDLVGTVVEPADEDAGEQGVLKRDAEGSKSIAEFFADTQVRGTPLPSVLDDVDDVEVLEPGGTDSHSAVGAEIIHGVQGGTAASLPTITCDDPKRVPKGDVDVVFVIDVSTTMGFMVDRVERGIVEVDAMLRALSKRPRYGLVVFVDDVELTNGGRAFGSVAELQAELIRWRNFTASNRQIHSTTTNRDWPENSLDALHSAATGFAWRPAESTARLLLHATDDDFGEAPTIQSGVPIRHTYQETLTVLRDHQIRVSSFSAKLGGECECLDVTRGLQGPFGELPSLPDGTGGASFDLDSVASGQLSLVAALRATLSDALCEVTPLQTKPDAEPL